MNIDVLSRGGRGRIRKVGLAVALLACAVITPIAVVLDSSPASASSALTTYSEGTPQLATMTSSSACTSATQGSAADCAPYNLSQGDPDFSSYDTAAQQAQSPYPTYTPGGSTVTETATNGSETSPNLAVYGGAASGTDGDAPYPSGVVGSPGSLAGYCGTGNNTTASNGTPARQTAGSTLPLAPAYFPHIVRNADGTLTGYFDNRPKDADESLVAATSTDGGKQWTYDGEALDQNGSYCPTADTNDDGEGHGNIVTIGSGTDAPTYLYTLERASGDNQGVGLIIHQLNPTEANPLASSAYGSGSLPTNEATGIDPDAFENGGSGTTVTVPTTGGTAVTLPITSIGSASGQSPEEFVTGAFVDVTADQRASQTPSSTNIINCTAGSGAITSLSSCTTPGSSITVDNGDMIEQVLGFLDTSASGTTTLLHGPNTTGGDGGTASLYLTTTVAGDGAAKASVTGFVNPLTGATYNTDAPGRVYLSGTAVYCAQGNSNPTTEVENCTVPGSTSLAISAGEVFTGDPIVPSTANNPVGSDTSGTVSDAVTNGLVSPDGIVGTVPSYPETSPGAVPSGATYVMYTEKELMYYVPGLATLTTGTGQCDGTYSASTACTITFNPQPYASQSLPTTSSSVTVTMGGVCSGTSSTSCTYGGTSYYGSTATGETVNNDSTFMTVTCAGGVNETTGVLTNCTLPAGTTGTWTYVKTTYVGAPGAATVPDPTLELTGEGSTSASKAAEKLFGNNEDLNVLRVAWTTDGVNFNTTGLVNNGIISGENNCQSGSAASACSTGSSTGLSSPYDDITNPSEQVSPTNLNEYANNDVANGTCSATAETSAGALSCTDTGGTADVDEMRFAGTAGSIIQNPDGSLGLFLSGAWAGDGDSDSFNQVFYSQSPAGAGEGEYWTVPVPVVSTDYSFTASSLQDSESTSGQNDPLGITAYYEGRAYGASVVANPDGTLTMVYVGYRLPHTTGTAGSTTVGTGPSTGETNSQWTVSAEDPLLYRNVLVDTLQPSSTIPTTTTLTPSTTTPVVGQPVTFTATVPSSTGDGNPTGTVTVTDSDSSSPLCTITLGGAGGPGSSDTGTCSYTYSSPTPSNSPDVVNATYAGDWNYETSSTTTAVDEAVSEDATTTSPPSASNGGTPANPAVVGEPVTLSSTVTVNAPGSGSPTGSISFSDGGSTPLCTGTLSNGSDTATCTYTPTNANAGDSITATYSGDSNDVSSPSTPLTEVVDAAATTAALTITPTSPLVGQSVTLSATVTPTSPGAGTPTGSVTFSGNGGTLCSAPLGGSSPATASCSTTYPGVTSDSVTASYPGDGNFASSSANSTVSVSQASTSTAVAPDDPTPVVGEQVTYTATVTVTPPGSGSPTGTVSFSGDGGALCTDAPVSSSGTATCVHAYTATGSDSVSADYSGDSNFGASGSTTSVVIGQDATSTTVTASPGPAVVGQPVTLTGTVAILAPGAGTPTGSVSFSDAGGTCSGTLSSAAPYTATCTTTYSAPASDDTVTGTYSGDANDAGSGGTTSETVNQDATTTVLTSSPTSPVVGQQVTYTASVSVNSPGAGTPTGTVVFTGNGDTTYCTSSLSGSDPATATCTKSYSAAGTDSVSATYGGDTNDQTSTGTEMPTIGQDATVTTSVSASPSGPVVGQTVTLKATVAVDSPGAGTPTGTVTFSGNGGAVCSGSLNALSPDTATCATSYAAATSGVVTASYGGDTNDIASSGTTTVAVGKGGTKTAVAANPSSPIAGQSTTLSATVTVKSPGSGVPTGSVTFEDASGTLCSGNLNASTPDVASCAASIASPGSSTVTGIYEGDSNFGGSDGSTTVTVGKGASTTALSSSANPAVTGQALSFSATVAAQAPSTGTPTGTVAFNFSGSGATPACKGGDTQTLTSGVATCKVSGGLQASQSQETVHAIYSGSSGFSSSTATPLAETINPSPSTVTISADSNPVVTSAGVTFTATLGAGSPGTGTPASGTVTWTVTSAGGSAVACKKANPANVSSAGTSTCKVPTNELSTAGEPYSVTAAFSGTDNYASSTGSYYEAVTTTASQVKLKVAAPASSGSPGSFTAVVTGVPNTSVSASSDVPTGTVTFTITDESGNPVSCDGGNNTITLSGSGRGTCTVSSSLVSSGSPYTVTATYNGDGTFSPSTSPTKSVAVTG